MKTLKKTLALLTAVLFVNLFLGGTVAAQENRPAKADITKHAPVIRSLPEEQIPVEVVKEGGGGKMVWGLLGLVAIGGVVAAAGGGGGGGDDGSTTDTGTVAVSW